MSRRPTTERVVYAITLDLPPGLSCTAMAKHLDTALRSYVITLENNDARIDPKVKLLERHVRYTT